MIAFFFVAILPTLIAVALGTYDHFQWKKAYEEDRQRRIEAYWRSHFYDTRDYCVTEKIRRSQASSS